MLAYKHFHFATEDAESNVKCLDVVISEVVDPQYGLFTWPCAPVLAQFIFQNQVLVANKRILEIGCGTALAGIVAAKVGAKVTFSDSEGFKNCLANCRKCCEENGLTNVDVIPITWGRITEDVLNLKDVDFILASDCFYDKKDFEDIIFLISSILEKNQNAIFWTTFHLRSCNDSIEELLLKWKLKCRFIPLEQFGADCEFVGGHDMSANHTIQMFEIRQA